MTDPESAPILPWTARVRQILWNLGLITVGSVLVSVAINGILLPQKFVSGGVVGVALGIHYAFPSLQVSWLYFLLNIPLFLMGWRMVGRRFLFYSIAGMSIFSLTVGLVHIPLPVYDRIPSAILAGIIFGLGSGTILRSLGSAGGADILSVILLNRYSIRPGSTILAANILVLSGTAFLVSLDAALYTLVYMYVSTQMVNVVLTGLSQRKSVFIISKKAGEIAREIMDKIVRGVTIIPGRGGYTGQSEEILYTVITFRELGRLKGIIKSIDSAAFVVVSDTLEVMGHRIGNQPHW